MDIKVKRNEILIDTRWVEDFDGYDKWVDSILKLQSWVKVNVENDFGIIRITKITE